MNDGTYFSLNLIVFMDNFEEFKDLLIKSSKAVDACSSGYRQLLESKTFHDLALIARDSFEWCVENGLITPEIIQKYSKDCNDLGIFCNQNVSNGFCLVTSGCVIDALEHSFVIVTGSGVVNAYGTTYVIAKDNSEVTAWDNVTVKALNNSSVSAKDFSRVHSQSSARIMASDNSCVFTSDPSLVDTYENALVIKQS